MHDGRYSKVEANLHFVVYKICTNQENQGDRLGVDGEDVGKTTCLKSNVQKKESTKNL